MTPISCKENWRLPINVPVKKKFRVIQIPTGTPDQMSSWQIATILWVRTPLPKISTENAAAATTATPAYRCNKQRQHKMPSSNNRELLDFLRYADVAKALASIINANIGSDQR